MTKADFRGPLESVRGMLRTPNTIGNWLSHLQLWRDVAGTGSIAGILEDDALLCEDFQDRLQIIERAFDEHDLPWDVFYLGATYHVNPPAWHADDLGRDFELTGIRHIHRVYGAFSNQGYLVNGRSAEKLLAMMEDAMPTARGSDHAMIRLQPKLHCYSFTPGMVFQIDGQSDIGKGVTMFSSFFESLGPHVWCNRLEEFDYDAYDWGPGIASTEIKGAPL